MKILLWIYWTEDGGENRFVRQGETRMHVADNLPDPPLTREEMQQIARAAKMEFGKIIRRRKQTK